MKVCLGCNEQKKLQDFNYKSKDKGTFQSQCKICTRKQVQRHYFRNAPYYIEKSRIRNKKERQIKREFIWKYLQDHHCVDCNEKDIIVLTFDHIAGKSHNISEMVGWGSSLKQIISEIAKCQVRCANCHQRKTAKQQGWLKSLRLRSSIG